ncbi:hypothetical protein UFOVP245_80 [uncultured Caudovirales phage]|uniref:EF-hand domain-containing protein n=1 Tax=uncultured Caudovirales phage TaxID=2100421 RepID=A0A6J7WSR8_9CAUD|nr:hypothetical protein UFOVP245_80 [uncultured Caudovirales phage]
MTTFDQKFKNRLAEVAQPLSKGEQLFKKIAVGDVNPTATNRNMIPGVTDQDHLFKGEPRKLDPKTASYENQRDVAVYDNGLTVEEGYEQMEAMDPVGKEDADVNNDGKVNKSDGFLKARRKAISASIKKEETELVDEGKYNWDKEHKRGMTDTLGNRMLTKKSFRPIGQRSKEDMRKDIEAVYKSAKDYKFKKEETELDEKHLTPAEMKKREQIAKAIHRENPGMNMSKKMAIATSSAKKLAEEALGDHAGLAKYADEHGRIDKEDLHTAAKHIKSGNMKALDKHLRAMDTDPRDKALEYVNKKHYEKLGFEKRGFGEEVEQIDEISSKLATNYIQKARTSTRDAYYGDDAKTSGKRKKGIDLALLKKWGDKKHGLPEPKVKATEEYVHVNEAKRGRPSKNASAEGEEGGREHIIVQLRKAENLRGTEKHVEFNDNSKHVINPAHVKRALDMHAGMKPAEKGEFEKRLAASHASFTSAVKGEAAPKPKPKISLGGRMHEMRDPSTTRADKGEEVPMVRRDKEGVLRVAKRGGSSKEIGIGEAKDMTTKNVKKMVKHDCASHVVHEKWGRGECIPEMHTIVETSDGEGYVTHYDVMFEHGIEQNVPVQALTIEKKMMHEHEVHEALVGKQKNIDKNNNGKIDAQDFKLLKAKKKMMESLKASMNQDSIDKEKAMSPAASKVNVKLPPSQGNKPVGGDQPSARVGGKFGMDESLDHEELLNSLYDSLSEDNQQKFLDKLETEEGYYAMVQFAREQGF